MPVILHSPPPCDLTAAEIEPWRKVPVAVAVDLGRTYGPVDPAIRPLNPPGRQAALFGRAFTVLCAPPDFGAVVHAMDRIGPGEVLVISAGGHAGFAMIGEILVGHLRRRGVAGLVCDGAIRDVGMLAGWADFPVYTRFITPRGPVSAEHGEIQGPVVLGGMPVRPGDLLLGDDDGLVALPPDVVRSRLRDAEDRLAREAGWIDSLARGTSAAETFGLAGPVGSGQPAP